ncbi:hypothetical protein [Pseudomonas lactucae]|uniref:Peptidase C58 YopT-type domain-containing protein n=1 Tax=Pseudomonas lactucae TaxID=2813360 RepID=A0A9X1C6N9_9PSED|nr:hypothetical protein [Pseudomonas lactucae]MBN2985534.1 hypothetical protein [Pseudomonas lactucae]
MNINPSSSLLSASSTSTPVHTRHVRASHNSPLAPPPSSAQSNKLELNTYNTTIYGTNTLSPPTSSYTIQERTQRIDAYADRVKAQIANIESGREGERNVKFQTVRQFMEPSGYFSAGLLAAGYDPHEKITVTFTSYTGMGKPDVLTDTQKRTYSAWEIAAGALAHDRVQRGGPLNFQFMRVEPTDQSRVNDLEAHGKNLQSHWENEIASPMRDASGVLAQRSGKADAYLIRGTLQSLSNNKEAFEKLSSEGQDALKRTLERNAQVIIPNIYGYHLSGYVFIPLHPYDGNYENRPNKGIMIDLKNGTAREIQGDNEFADWAKDNRDALLSRFNARDLQGGKDAHWPSARYVLDNLIAGNSSHYPGYRSLVSDEAIPVRELFNYTRARDTDYALKYGNLNNEIAPRYQAVNANNAVWSDQTEVFGSSQQSWKNAKDFWGETFGRLPIVGTTGNIVFGAHDGIYGMTLDDRVGGNAAAVISSLQLAHEVLPVGIETELGEPHMGSANPQKFSWRYNSKTNDFELVRAPSPQPVVPAETPGSIDGFIDWVYDFLSKEEAQPQLSKQELIEFRDKYNSSRSPSSRANFDNGYNSGKLEDVPGYSASMTMRDLIKMASEPWRSAQEVGTLSREISRLKIKLIQEGHPLFQQDIQNAGGKLTPMPQEFYLSQTHNLGSLGECAAMANTMGLAMESGQENVFLGNLFKAAARPEEPASVEFIKKLTTLQNRMNDIDLFHTGPTRQVPYGEIIADLANSVETKTLRISSKNHALLAGVNMDGEVPKWFYFDPNFGLATFDTPQAFQAGLERTLNRGTSPFRLQALGNDPAVPEYTISDFKGGDYAGNGLGATMRDLFTKEL